MKIIRAFYSIDSGGIHTARKADINRTFHQEIIGWARRTRTAALVLLAPTFITFSPITIITVAVLRARGYKQLGDMVYFDPSDALLFLHPAPCINRSRPWMRA